MFIRELILWAGKRLKNSRIAKQKGKNGLGSLRVNKTGKLDIVKHFCSKFEGINAVVFWANCNSWKDDVLNRVVSCLNGDQDWIGTPF